MKLNYILNWNFFYNLYQSLIGSDIYLNDYVTNYLKPRNGDSVLEFGCGTGNIYALFKEKDVKYTGIDYNSDYISYSKKKYPRQTFICSDVTAPVDFDCEFDIVICEAMMSALPDDKVLKMFETIKACSNEKTRIILSDMNYRKSASKLERFLMEHERNEYVRTREDYIGLISKCFKIEKISVIEKPYRIPYQKIIFECFVS